MSRAEDEIDNTLIYLDYNSGYHKNWIIIKNLNRPMCTKNQSMRVGYSRSTVGYNLAGL
jgi:hypothetical protein